MPSQFFNFQSIDNSTPSLLREEVLSERAHDADEFFESIRWYQTRPNRIARLQVEVLKWFQEKGYINDKTLIQEIAAEQIDGLGEYVTIFSAEAYYSSLEFKYYISTLSKDGYRITVKIFHNYITMSFGHYEITGKLDGEFSTRLISAVVADMIREICNKLDFIGYQIRPYNPIELEVVYSTKDFKCLKDIGAEKYYSVATSSGDTRYVYQLDELCEIGRFIVPVWEPIADAPVMQGNLIDLQTGQIHEVLKYDALVGVEETFEYYDSQGRTWQYTQGIVDSFTLSN